jgi:drug/metabolite transporter (DMT)-like permease
VTRRGWLLFAVMCVVWGIPYLMIRVAVRDVTPAFLVFARTGIAGLLLVPIAAWRGELAPLLRRLRPFVAYTVIEIAVPWILLADAETHLSSSITGLLIAAVPLAGAVMFRLLGDEEQLSKRRLLGLAIGIVGVGALVGLDLGRLRAVSVLELCVVVVCYAAGPIVVARKLDDVPPLGVVAASLGLAALLYVPAGVAQFPDHAPAGWGIVSIVALAVVCSALAFVVFFALIAEVGPARASVITYVNPAVAGILGVALLGEAFTVGLGVGFLLVLAGSVLATRRSVVVAEP